MNISPYLFCYKMVVPIQNNPKNLDPSYKNLDPSYKMILAF